MLSQVSKGLLIFLHGNWPWVGDAAFWRYRAIGDTPERLPASAWVVV
jgi:hypothetical protein